MISLIDGLYFYIIDQQKTNKLSSKCCKTKNNKVEMIKSDNMGIMLNFKQNYNEKYGRYNWWDLINLYKKFDKFSEHRVMWIAFKINVFIQLMSEINIKYKLFWLERNSALNLSYENSAIENINLMQEFTKNQSFYNQTHRVEGNEFLGNEKELKILKFISQICSSIEVVDFRRELQ